MTFQEAVLLLPKWVQIWMNVLLLGAFAAPLFLLIWKQTRKTGAITFVVSVLSGLGVQLMYNSLGLVRLLGLPHIILWTPLVIYLLAQLRRDDLTRAPIWIIRVVLATIIISLVFDYYDAIRYLLGDTAPTI